MPHETDFPPDLRALEREYELIRELGQGGMAAVYLARHRATSRLVAIKAIRARYLDDPDALQRFAREARTVADLDHPNIVRTHAIEQIDDRAVAIIMEHVGGGTVRDRLREYGSLGAEQSEGILRDVASALRYAHARGIVHRDVKPENIFLDAETGRALLSDFGIARRIEGDAAITLLGAALGTPQYMSPEQIDGEMVDGRSDIYSLGVLGWELLTGRRPWAGESLYGVIYKQKHEDLPRITAVRPRVPANLLFAIEGALVKDRTRRWQSVDEFLHQLTYNPPPVLAQTFPPGVTPPADVPTVRFRSPALELPAAADDGGADGGALLPVAAAAPPVVMPPASPIHTGPVGPEVTDRGTAAHTRARAAAHAPARTAAGNAMADQAIAGVEYELPEFTEVEPDWGPRFERGRVGRAVALLVPLTIAGVSLFVVLGGRWTESSASGVGSPTLTSSGGTIAAAGVPATDSAKPPRTVAALRGGIDSASQGRRALGGTAAPDAQAATPDDAQSPQIATRRSVRSPIAYRPSPARSPRPGAQTAAGSAPSAEGREGGDSSTGARAADARYAAESGSAPARVGPAAPAATGTNPVLEDPFRPPTSPVAASSRVAPGGASGGGAAVPSPRCRLASSADQRACLDAYIVAGDARMERAFDAIVRELRRVAHAGPNDPDPTALTRVRVEQRAWLSIRNNECARQPPAGAEPFWAELQSRCFTEMSAARADELQEAVRRLRRK